MLRASDTGSGPTVVLLHGLFGAAQNFASAQRHLARQFRVIALDLRNHGASPHDPDMSYPAMANDVLDTLARLAALPAALIGHSMGGKVAMRAALARPDAVRRLIVADIAPVSYPPTFGGYAAAMAALPLTPGLTRRAAEAALTPAVPDPRVRSFLAQNLRLGAAPAWRIGLAEIAAALPRIEGWEAPAGAIFHGPALFLAGARSDYIRQEHRAGIRALFPAARFVSLKELGHWLHADNPDGFVAVVEAFLQDRT